MFNEVIIVFLKFKSLKAQGPQHYSCVTSRVTVLDIFFYIINRIAQLLPKKDTTKA